MHSSEFKLKRIVTLLPRDVGSHTSFRRIRRCAVCDTPLKAEPVQVLVERGDWHAGWQPLSCLHCSQTETRFVIVRGDQPLVYQTHPVC